MARTFACSRVSTGVQTTDNLLEGIRATGFQIAGRFRLRLKDSLGQPEVRNSRGNAGNVA